MFLFLYCANNNRVLTALKQRKSERMTAASQDPSVPSQRESSEGARSAVETRRQSRESHQRRASCRVYLLLHCPLSVQVHLAQHRLRAMTNDSSFEYRTDREDRENPAETCHKKPEMRNVCWNRDDIIERKLYDIFSVAADPSPAAGFLPSVSSRVGNNA